MSKFFVLLKHLISQKQVATLLKMRLSQRQFLAFAAIVVGFSVGVLAFFLKTLVHFLQSGLDTDRMFSPEKSPFMLILPTVGILLTVFFIQKVLKGDLGRGVSDILFEIAKKNAFVKRHKIFSHIITAAITVGLGGSAGLEAPIVITGSAVGSNLARTWRLMYRERVLLLGCGAAAGIGAVFNAPIAGVMFAMEVILAEVALSSLVPLVIAAACGALFSKIIFKESILFSFEKQQDFDYHNLPFYLLLAFLSGLVSLWYVRVAHSTTHFFKQMSLNVYLKALLGGVLLAFLMAMLPTLFSEGYPTIRLLADVRPDTLLKNSFFSDLATNNWAIVAFLTATLLIKPIATAITLGAGGNGGNFAPSLFVGANLGFAFARAANILGFRIPESNFAIVGMAGVLAGVMYAPLTAIFLIAEVTGGYDLFIPLMLVATLSHLVVRSVEPTSLETKAMQTRGEVFSQDKDRNILMLMRTSSLIETDFGTVQVCAHLGDLVTTIKKSHRNLFAVLNTEGGLEGIITLDDVREIMFDVNIYDKVLVKQIMKLPPEILTINESMDSVMMKFDNTQAWNLPVLENGKYIGFISKSTVFSKYRTQLMSISGEQS